MKVIDQYVSNHAAIYHGDCVEGVSGLPDSSIDFSVFSPPFEGLFVYSANDRDMGNSHGSAEFAKHLSFLAAQMFRVVKPGRMVAIHCMDLPMTLTHHGAIGFVDFPGRLREVYAAAGFVYYGRITIWKDPVVAQERTHARQLVHHEMVKDSAMSGVGCPDYIVLMRKPGENAEPIAHVGDSLATKNDAGKPEQWQRHASPVWAMPESDLDANLRALAYAIRSGDDGPAERIAGDIARRYGKADGMPAADLVWATANGIWKDGFVDYEDPRGGNPDKRGIDQGDTLNYRAAREHDDERHICPLQRGVVRRLLMLYTNRGDKVLTPFLGIGTEVVTAIEEGRLGVGFELKPSYFKQAVEHVKRVEPGAAGQQTNLLDMLAPKNGTCDGCAEQGPVGDCGICGGKVS